MDAQVTERIGETLDALIDQLEDKDMNNVRIGFRLATSLFWLSTWLADKGGHEDALILMKQVLEGKVCDTKENMKRYQRLALKTTMDLLEGTNRLKTTE